jgi:cyclin-dependent kinase 7
MGMLGRAIWFCHENFVLHRDIKPNNLMIAADGEIKLADFGLARSFSDPYRAMSHEVITRWYRPLELFYGARFYSAAVDIWAVGLVFAELILRTPFIPGESDVHQVELICQAIGTPTEDNWPGVTQLPNYVKPETFTPVRGRDFYMGTFATVGQLGVELLMSTLALDPRKRVTAKQFLQHSWWTSDPRPTRKEDLPRKAGGAEKMGSDMGKKPGEIGDGRGEKLARKLDFGAKR